MTPRHNSDVKKAMFYNFGCTDTRWNFRYECVMLVTYIGGLINLPYVAGTSAKLSCILAIQKLIKLM
jgi:hypothetical protein